MPDETQDKPAAEGSSTARQKRAERAAQLRKHEQAAERRRRVAISVAVIVVAAVVLGAGGYAIKSAHDDKVASAPTRKVITPPGTEDSAVVVPPSQGTTLVAGAPKVEVYEDFLCPVCGNFEKQSGSYLQDAAAQGEIQLVYRPISILNSRGDGYSSRAASAALCAFEADGSEGFVKAHNALYSDQPSEAGPFPSNNTIYKTVSVAEGTGRSCVVKQRYAPWSVSISKADQHSDGNWYLKKWPTIQASTPTLLINGKQSDAWSSLDNLKAAIDAA